MIALCFFLCPSFSQAKCDNFCSILKKNKKSFVETSIILEDNLNCWRGNLRLNLAICPKHKIKSKASGISIGTDQKSNQSLILTAGHVCKDDVVERGIELNINMTLQVATLEGGTYFLTSKPYIDPKYDLCYFFVSGIIPPVKIAKRNPVWGETYSILANPRGYFEPKGKKTDGILLSFLGVYGGNADFQNARVDFYSAPISTGSSGGSVFNDDGEIVGIIFAKDANFSHIALVVPLDVLQNLNIKKILKSPKEIIPPIFSNELLK